MKLFLIIALLLSLALNFFLAGIWLGSNQHLEQKAFFRSETRALAHLSPESQQKLQPLLQQKQQVLQQKLRETQKQRQVFLGYLAQEKYDRKQAETLFATWQKASQESQGFLQGILLEAAEQLPPGERQRLFRHYTHQNTKKLLKQKGGGE
jgi:uncharacterized membrane protein